jgi:hypothetical protein
MKIQDLITRWDGWNVKVQVAGCPHIQTRPISILEGWWWGGAAELSLSCSCGGFMSFRVNLTVRHFPQHIHKNDLTSLKAYCDMGYKTDVLYGCQTWYFMLREEHWLGVFENRVLRRIFAPRGIKWQEVGENCIARSSIICTLHLILGWTNQGRLYNVHGVDEKCVQNFGSEAWR